MADLSTDKADVLHTGEHTFRNITLPVASVKKEAIAAAAGIEASKLQHQHRIPYGQPNTTATSETRVVYRCFGVSGTVTGFHAGSIAKAVGDSTVTVDLKKNGTSVLTAPITLNNANTNRVPVAGTLSGTPALAANDVLEIVTVATAGTGTLPTGVFASVNVEEDAQ